MRISDWSSDVCSSDLRVEAALRERLHVTVHRLDLVAPRSLGRQELVLHLLEMLANDMQAGVRQQVMDVGDPPGAGVLDRDHGIARAAIVHRSEEHTSELQSLMRISYAVFCLKKKK